MPSASPSPAAHAETTPRTSARGDPTGSAPPGSASLLASPRRRPATRSGAHPRRTRRRSARFRRPSPGSSPRSSAPGTTARRGAVPSPRRPRCALGQGAATGRGPAGVCSCRLPHPVRLCLLGAEALGGQAGGLAGRPAADELDGGEVAASLGVPGRLAVAVPAAAAVADRVGGVGAADVRLDAFVVDPGDDQAALGDELEGALGEAGAVAGHRVSFRGVLGVTSGPPPLLKERGGRTGWGGVLAVPGAVPALTCANVPRRDGRTGVCDGTRRRGRRTGRVPAKPVMTRPPG